MLEEKRVQIDQIDQQIMKLLDQRFVLTDQIGLFKHSRHLPIENSNREAVINNKIKEITQNSKEISEIYQLIMNLSKQRQRNL